MNYKNASTLQALTALSGGPTSNSVKAHYKKPKVMPFCCLAQAIENQAQTSARNKMGGGGAGGAHMYTSWCLDTILHCHRKKKKEEKNLGHPEWGNRTVVLRGQKQKINGLKLAIQSIR